MPEAQDMIYLLLSVMQFLTGVFANGIILVVNGIGLIKQRMMAPLDLLLFCLATSRIFMQLFVFLVHLIILSLLKRSVFSEIVLMVMVTNESSLWFATWLGVFYCVKIATITHPLFLWLKMKISKMMPWLILVSLLYTIVTCVIYSKCIPNDMNKTMLSFFSKNATSMKEVHAMPFSLFIIGLTLSSLIFLIAVLLLIFSLGRHTQQMRTIVTGTRDSGRNAHINAMLSILSFLVLHVCHYMMVILLYSQVFQCGSHLFFLCLLVGGAYPSIHSIILIFGNSKLKQNAKMFLLHGKCCQ